MACCAIALRCRGSFILEERLKPTAELPANLIYLTFRDGLGERLDNGAADPRGVASRAEAGAVLNLSNQSVVLHRRLLSSRRASSHAI
jgi:hypothetical protein